MSVRVRQPRLRELTEQVRTWTPARDAPDDEIDYIDIGSVDPQTKTIETRPRIAASTAPSRARQIVKHGDVLVSTVRPNLNGVAQVPEHLDGATASTGFCVLRPDKAKLDGAYLFQWVKTPDFVSAMTKQATGQSYPAVSDRIVHESNIPLPPLPEQRRIAAILDAADSFRAKRRAALAKLDQLAQSIFIEMFGDPGRHGWPMTTVADMADQENGAIRTGPFGSQLLHSEFVDEGSARSTLSNWMRTTCAGTKQMWSKETLRQPWMRTISGGTSWPLCGRSR